MAMRGFDRRLGRLGAAALTVLVALGGLPASVRADNAPVLTVTAPSPTRAYGVANPPLAPTIAGFVNGQGPSDLDTPPTCSSSADVSSPVGTYPVTCSGGADAEYSFDYVPGTLTVERAAITVTADAATKVYGGADPALTYQVTSGALAPGDAVAGSLARAAGEDVGSYAISQGTLALGASYDLSFVGASLSITPAPLVITPANQTKTVGTTFTAFTGTVAGLRGSDVITATYSSAGAPASAAIGTYPIVAMPVDAGGRLANYSVTLNAGTLAVQPVPPAATTVDLASSLNPAPPRQPVTLIATVSSIPSAQGTVQLQSSPDGTTWSDVGNPVAVTAIGSAFGATIPVTMPATEQTIRYRAVFASDDPALGGSTSPELAQIVAKAAATVALSATPEAWEASVPVAIRATVAPAAPGVTVRVAGTVGFSIDDGPSQTVPVVDGVAELPAMALALGPHTVTATHSGDESFRGGTTASLTRTVAANLVNASGVGVSGASIYPIKDAWRDTIAIRGTRNERLGVSIRIYSPAGKLLSTRSIAVGSGPYSSTWNGRTTAGIILPPGRYRIVQTLADPSTVPALTKAWTSYVTLSTKRMTWRTVTFTVDPGPRNYRFSSGQGVGAASTSSAGALVLAGQDGGWPAVGYEFRLPEASAYREIRFQVLGTVSGATPTLGLQRWSSGGGWGQVYRADFSRTAVTPSATTWRGLTSKSPAPFVSAARRVRGYVDGGGRLAGSFRLRMTGVRLVVVYGILK